MRIIRNTLKALMLMSFFIFSSSQLFSQILSNDTTYSIGGLKFLLPKGFVTNSHVGQEYKTSFRKEGATPNSSLIVSFLDLNDSFNPEEIEELRQDFETFCDYSLYGLLSQGWNLKEKSSFVFKGQDGMIYHLKAEMYGYPTEIVAKMVLYKRYFVVFLELYGANLETEYERIENSISEDDGAATTGMQTINEGPFSFQYDSDKVFANSKSRSNDSFEFTFSLLDSTPTDCFFEITISDTKVDDLQKKTEQIASVYLDQYIKNADQKPTKEDMLLGKKGYSTEIIGVVNGFPVKLIVRTCLLDGKLVWSNAQLPVDDDGAIFNTIEKTFNNRKSGASVLE